MIRDQLIQRLRRYARKENLDFEIDTKKGKRSHYIVTVDGKFTTVQIQLNPCRIDRLLKQPGVDIADL